MKHQTLTLGQKALLDYMTTTGERARILSAVTWVFGWKDQRNVAATVHALLLAGKLRRVHVPGEGTFAVVA